MTDSDSFGPQRARSTFKVPGAADRELVYFTIIGKASFGDMDGCATVEIAKGRTGWFVSAGPTRPISRRPTAVWVDEAGRRRLFPSALAAMGAVARERPAESLRWGQKIRPRTALPAA